MAPVNILKFPTSSPSDTTPVQLLQDAGYDQSRILGVVGKTEGNGCVNDFSRTLSAHVWQSILPTWAVSVFSGGTEGVLTPHVTFIVQHPHPTGLVACVGRTRTLQPQEIGTTEHARQVGLRIRSMVEELKEHKEIENQEAVKLALVKCPLLTSAKIEAIKAQDLNPITEDTYESMAKSRYASAVGVALGLGEMEDKDLTGSMDKKAYEFYSNKASCSSGAELDDCHILILASGPPLPPERVTTLRLGAIAGCMTDAIDADAIISMLKEIQDRRGRLIQVFAKAEADPSGLIRGRRHTMNTDSDIHSTRHARAAVGGLLAGLVKGTEIYVSGGAEGQGPDGGGSLCMVYSVEDDVEEEIDEQIKMDFGRGLK